MTNRTSEKQLASARKWKAENYQRVLEINRDYYRRNRYKMAADRARLREVNAKSETTDFTDSHGSI